MFRPFYGNLRGERETRESEYQRPLQFFKVLLLLRYAALAAFTLLLPLAIGSWYTLFLIAFLLIYTFDWSLLYKRKRITTLWQLFNFRERVTLKRQFPRMGMTLFEFGLFLALIVFFGAGWILGGYPHIWHYSLRPLIVWIEYPIDWLWHGAIGGWWLLWLRLFVVLAVLVSYEPWDLLQYVFIMESELPGARNVTLPGAVGEHITPHGLRIRRPGEKAPAAPVGGVVDFYTDSDEEVTL